EVHVRRSVLAAVVAGAELRVGDSTRVAIGEPEIHAGLRRDVELVVGNVIAEQIASVVGEPKLLGRRMPIEAYAVAHAAAEDHQARAVGLQASDRPVGRLALTDVAGRAHRDVEESVGSESDHPRAVPLVGRITVVDDDRPRRMLEPALYVIEAKDARG